MSDPVKIGISACLLGECVRYDGGHKRSDLIIETFGRWAEFVPVCPEVECGLPVPRPPMQLYDDPATPRIIEIESRIDHSIRMIAWAENCLDELSHENLAAFIFKAKSPSCGLRNIIVASSDEGLPQLGRGLWTKLFINRFPEIPVEDNESMQIDSIRVKLIERIREG